MVRDFGRRDILNGGLVLAAGTSSVAILGSDWKASELERTYSEESEDIHQQVLEAEKLTSNENRVSSNFNYTPFLGAQFEVFAGTDIDLSEYSNSTELLDQEEGLVEDAATIFDSMVDRVDVSSYNLKIKDGKHNYSVVLNDGELTDSPESAYLQSMRDEEVVWNVW